MRLFLSVLTLTVLQLKQTQSLSCLSCQNKDDPQNCNITMTCPTNQVCFLEEQGGIYNLGCSDNQHCGGTATGPGLIGRSVDENQIYGHALVSRQSPNCLECCSTDGCNLNLCKHAIPTQCLDDPTVDCAKLNTLFHICQTDQQQASLVCPKFCNLCTMVHGEWTDWSTWSRCDVTCGNGTETRGRTCTNPSPANGGRDCIGLGTETKSCQEDPCPVHGGWSTWSQWGSCSVTCDVGMQRRDRSCSNPYPSLSGDHCFGDSRDDRICLAGACSDGGWSVWSSWSACSESCGGGIRSQTRTCTNPKPSLLGKQCDGSSMKVTLCNKHTCPDHKVAFAANRITGFATTMPIFTHVIYNYGNGYSTSTGKFTCSIPGIYYFSVHLAYKFLMNFTPETSKIDCSIYVNSALQANAVGTVETGYIFSFSGTYQLKEHDTVYVGGCKLDPPLFVDRNSYFNGFLVYPDA